MDFDPRSSPIWKRYRYCVRNSQVEDAFLSPFSWRVGEKLDLDLMRAEAESLVGQHDFRAFRSVDDERKETVRHIHSLTVSEDRSRERVLNIEVQGNRFMYNMVRIIAGTLVDVGRGRRKPGAGRRAIETGERRELGMTAPPQGLTLEHVELRQWGEDVWPSEPY